MVIYYSSLNGLKHLFKRVKLKLRVGTHNDSLVWEQKDMDPTPDFASSELLGTWVSHTLSLAHSYLICKVKQWTRWSHVLSSSNSL